MPEIQGHHFSEEELAKGQAEVDRLHAIKDSLIGDTGQTAYSDMLLPCPFCGGRAWLQTFELGDCCVEARVVCGDCHVSTSRDFESVRTTYLPTGEDLTRLYAIEKAIRTWNRRVG